MNRRTKPIFVFRVLPVLMLIGIALWSFDASMRPAVESMSVHQARIFAARAVNEAMAQELSAQDVSYGEIITVTQNQNGEVSAIRTNMAEIARLQTRLTSRVLDELVSREQGRVLIPLGTLMGEQLLSGRGPLITIRLVPVGSMQTRISNEFISAGINQTLHRIMLEAEMQVQTIFPGYVITTDTLTRFTVAETVIVGNVPEGYTVITGDDRHLISRVNDYAAH
ncbi:MAG: sporulation protein YunB [Oscillospiraceae bacterium]|nr:sporulation protein YunB [Oscillospiraceae bacterium]